jgi:hypothetical protein
MMNHFGCYPTHASTVECPKCGKKGSIVWEDVPRPDGVAKELVRIDGDFFERIARKPPYPIELVCNGCGTPQA